MCGDTSKFGVTTKSRLNFLPVIWQKASTTQVLWSEGHRYVTCTLLEIRDGESGGDTLGWDILCLWQG